LQSVLIKVPLQFQIWHKESLAGVEKQIIITGLPFCDTNAVCMLLCHLRAKGYSENEVVMLKYVTLFQGQVGKFQNICDLIGNLQI